MKLLHDVIAVKRRKANTVIELVGHEEHIGEVVAVGPGRLLKRNGKEILQPMTLEVGEHIMFSHRAGMEREIDGEMVLFMREQDVLCVLDPDQVKTTDSAQDEARECVGAFNHIA